jgi:hypothetical protein
MQVAEFRGECDDCIGLNTERVQRRQAAEPGTQAPYLRSLVRIRFANINWDLNLVVVHIQKFKGSQTPYVILDLTNFIVVYVQSAKATPGKPAKCVRYKYTDLRTKTHTQVGTKEKKLNDIRAKSICRRDARDSGISGSSL